VEQLDDLPIEESRKEIKGMANDVINSNEHSYLRKVFKK
jgi:hypothetical protein